MMAIDAARQASRNNWDDLSKFRSVQKPVAEPSIVALR
jgi:hypothetical protein